MGLSANAEAVLALNRICLGLRSGSVRTSGALKGGRIVAERPGWKPAALYEGRDLQPTTDRRAAPKGRLLEHLRVDAKLLANTAFPSSDDVSPTAGLIG
jgi:uncharacterized protein (DUF1501 family)